MLKIIDVMIEKQSKRIEEGKGTKIDHAMVNWANKTWDKHPKIWEFIEKHRTGVDIAMDVAMTAALINLGYQLGKAGMLKDFNSAGEVGSAVMKLTDDGKGLIFAFDNVRNNGKLITATKFTTENQANLLTMVNVATEALKNQGVDLHTI